MKRMLISAALMLAIAATAVASPRTKLIRQLRSLQKQGIMLGHQDDPLYGHTWAWEEGRSDVLETTGSYPKVMGFELGHIELDSARSLDGVPFDRMRQEIRRQHERGGIVTLSWHPDNPLTGKSAWNPEKDNVSPLMPDSVGHQTLVTYLDRVAQFIASFKDIPVIFRPWHEMSGDWFWWGTKSCTPEQYRWLYQFTHDYLVYFKRLNNIVWAYSPNLVSDGETDSKYLQFYPGDRFVDLLGIDIYDFAHDREAYTRNMKSELDVLARVGRQHKKLIALTETGCQELPFSDWFTQTLWPAIKDYPLSYVLLWRNAWDNPKELYVSYEGHKTEADFKAFCKKMIMIK